MSQVHPSIKWGLGGAVIQGHYLPEREPPNSDLLSGLTEGTITLFVGLLVERVELDLKDLLARHLQMQNPRDWWATLPSNVQRLAQKRYEWSRGTLGTRRVGRFPNICWLTFGDTLKALDAMGPIDWQVCLRAETRRRRSFMRVATRVKSFRDYHIAHPKPRDVTTHDIQGLCNATRGLASVLRPKEWRTAREIVRRERQFLIPVESSNGHDIDHATASYRAAFLKWWDRNYGDWTRWKVGVETS